MTLELNATGHLVADMLCAECGARATEYGQVCRGLEIFETVTCGSCGAVAAEERLS